MYRLILMLPVFLMTVSIADQASATDPKSFKCEQPLPVFTLGPDSDPSKSQIEELCKCVWSKLPEGGWERRTSTKIRAGEDPGWRVKGFIPRFGKALDDCGGREL